MRWPLGPPRQTLLKRGPSVWVRDHALLERAIATTARMTSSRRVWDADLREDPPAGPFLTSLNHPSSGAVAVQSSGMQSSGP